jgi:hypothetical protein
MNRIAAAGALALAFGLLPGAAPAQPRTFQLGSPLPVAIEVRILADAPGFPRVVRLPAPPLPPVPVPYPDVHLRLQVKQGNGQWSAVITVPWRPGPVALPLPLP